MIFIFISILARFLSNQSQMNNKEKSPFSRYFFNMPVIQKPCTNESYSTSSVVSNSFFFAALNPRGRTSDESNNKLYKPLDVSSDLDPKLIGREIAYRLGEVSIIIFMPV